MRHKKRDRLELRLYELPQHESALALTGESWVGYYGSTDICMHFHNLFEIGYCHRGRGMLVLGSEEHIYESGTFSAIPANFPHITVSEGEDFWEFLYIDPAELVREMYPDNSPRQAEILAAVNRCAELFSVAEYPELAAYVRKILDETLRKRPHYREAVNYLVKLYLLELVRIRESRGGEMKLSSPLQQNSINQILPAVKYIEENYHQGIRAADLARCCGMSEPHFRRVFEAQIEMPPMDYLNLIRIQNACKLMRKKDGSMDVIASECGFTSVSTFTRNFKKFLDITPYQWKMSPGNYQRRLLDYIISTSKGRDSL